MARHTGSGWAVELQQQECGECGVVYAVPSHLAQGRQEKGGSLWCPNGHEVRYPAGVAELPVAQPAREAQPVRRPPGRLKDAEKRALAFLVTQAEGSTLEELAAHMGSAQAAQTAKRGLKLRNLIHGQAGRWRVTRHGRELVGPAAEPAPVH